MDNSRLTTKKVQREIRSETSGSERVLGIVSSVILAATIVEAVILMAHHSGLIAGLDFGAGAYYYADIPNFQRFTGQHLYQSGTPAWVIFLLFLAWGALMYKFWIFVDRRSRNVDSSTDKRAD